MTTCRLKFCKYKGYTLVLTPKYEDLPFPKCAVAYWDIQIFVHRVDYYISVFNFGFQIVVPCLLIQKMKCSEIWKYFQLSTDQTKAVCQICDI